MGDYKERSESERARFAAETLAGLDEGFHYSTLSFDEDGRVVAVVWNYVREPGGLYPSDDFTDPDESKRRRAMAIEHQEQYRDGEVATP